MDLIPGADLFTFNINHLLQNYEGYFSFGHINGIVIDNDIIFLNLEYDFKEDVISWATSSGYVSILKTRKDYDAEEAFRFSSACGKLDVVRYLFERLTAAHTIIEGLVWAAGNGHLNVVKYLTERGVDIRADKDNAFRAAAGNGHLNVVKYLTERGVDIHSEGEEAFIFAVKHNHLDVVKYLAKYHDIVRYLLDRTVLISELLYRYLIR